MNSQRLQEIPYLKKCVLTYKTRTQAEIGNRFTRITFTRMCELQGIQFPTHLHLDRIKPFVSEERREELLAISLT